MNRSLATTERAGATEACAIYSYAYLPTHGDNYRTFSRRRAAIPRDKHLSHAENQHGNVRGTNRGRGSYSSARSLTTDSGSRKIQLTLESTLERNTTLIRRVTAERTIGQLCQSCTFDALRTADRQTVFTPSDRREKTSAKGLQ